MRKRVQRDRQGERSGRGERGFSLIELLIVLVVMAILVSIALPNYMQSRKAANESSAIASMHALVSAEETYRIARTPPKYGWLADLADAGCINGALGTGSKRGYTFITLKPSDNTYAFIGKPDLNAGDRWFYVDQTGVIRVSDTEPSKDSPPLK